MPLAFIELIILKIGQKCRRSVMQYTFMHSMLVFLERLATTFSHHGIFSLGLLLIVGYVFGKLAERIRFPAITGYILAGIFVEYGIEEVTIIQSQQMENLLSRVPLFLGFFNFTGESSRVNRIVLAKIDETRLGAVVKAIEDVVGDLDFHAGLNIQVIDLFYSKGAF